MYLRQLQLKERNVPVTPQALAARRVSPREVERQWTQWQAWSVHRRWMASQARSVQRRWMAWQPWLAQPAQLQALGTPVRRVRRLRATRRPAAAGLFVRRRPMPRSRAFVERPRPASEAPPSPPRHWPARPA